MASSGAADERNIYLEDIPLDEAQARLRTAVLALGLTIILSTFVLGIHWLPDMIAGVAVGFLSVAVARAVVPVDEPLAR